MRPSSQNIDPSLRATVLLGIFLAAIWSVVYVIQPNYIEHLQLKVSDAIIAGAPATDISDKVVMVNIDERSLQAWGQWPWPRSRLATLLETLTDLGARSIAMDFILAETDRTSRQSNQQQLNSESGDPLNRFVQADKLTDNDATLAATLDGGPFVLGYEFRFDTIHQANHNCHLHPVKLVDVQQAPVADGMRGLYEAQGVVCNLMPFAHAASYSGFLNGKPDGDGRLRRLPLVIRYNGAVYPNLALAALLCADHQHAVILKQRKGDQCCLIAGEHTIPMDAQGNLQIHFSDPSSTLRQVTADQVLTGQVSKADIGGRVVMVGVGASGLSPTFLTPSGRLVSPVEVQAQALETMLSGNYIRRQERFVFIEIIFSLLTAVLLSFCVARLNFLVTAAIGGAGVIGIWTGAQGWFNSQQMFLSPLLPTAVILINGIFLMLFKYRTRQQRASQRMQDALILMKNSETNLNAIIQTIPDIVFRLDTSGRIIFISPALTKYRKHPEELIGSHILDLVATEDKEVANHRMNERRTGKRATVDLEVRLQLSATDDKESDEGRFFSVSAEGIYTAMPPETRSFSGTQGIAKDINERKHLERKLEQSKKMEAIGGLAAGVAHDLNNILSGLVSYPELLLLDLPADSPMRSKIETIQRSGQRAADIVQDLLMISRQGIKDHDCINLNSVINIYLKTPECERLKQCHPNIRIQTELADDLMNIRGSAVHMCKAIMNLAGNAAEAMPAGGVIRVMTRNRYLDTDIDRYERIPEGEYVILRVSDEGIGIPAGELHRIFEPFFSKKQMGRSGSGLGMTVIWNTIKDHAGYVDVRSREGDGTRFDIFLPATREENRKTKARFVLQDYLGTERILIVDDVPEQLDIAVKMLGKLGYRVASASGGEEAVTHLKTNHVDLVVLDMVMPPGIDGLETYERILEYRPAQKVIIASGYAASDRVKRMQDLGAGEYIRKPYTLEKIGLAVRRELDRHKENASS
jgi:two-component system, cell cycle sensor histidine kinase and response regulator CckA